jgi:hypothetical protein
MKPDDLQDRVDDQTDHERRRHDARRRRQDALTDPVSKFIPAFRGQQVDG